MENLDLREARKYRRMCRIKSIQWCTFDSSSPALKSQVFLHYARSQARSCKTWPTHAPRNIVPSGYLARDGSPAGAAGHRYAIGEIILAERPLALSRVRLELLLIADGGQPVEKPAPNELRVRARVGIPVLAGRDAAPNGRATNRAGFQIG